MARAAKASVYSVLRQVPPSDEDKPPQIYGGYMNHFERDEYGGSCAWGPCSEADVIRDLYEAIAVAVLVGEHEGVCGAVVLDAQTLQRVDSDVWKPRTMDHPDSQVSIARRSHDREAKQAVKAEQRLEYLNRKKRPFTRGHRP